MQKLWILALAILAKVFLSLGFGLGMGPELALHLAPDTLPDVQEEAARAVIQRVIGPRSSQLFLVEVSRILDFRSFQISMLDSGQILIAGWDGVSVCKGFHHYLKYVLERDVDWFKMRIELPTNLQLPNVTIRSTSTTILYHQNVCTWSYSFAWWGFEQWRRHIDWMAMMGISLTIAPVQEAVWQDVYTQLGLSGAEIEAHLAGPAFQAWQRMGNIRGWGGPLKPEYQRLQELLQKHILRAQRDLGISVALPAFAGHLPTAMRRIYPNGNYTEVERWNSFPDPYCCGLFVDPLDPIFDLVAALFLRRVVQRYGSNHIFFCDPFNELQPPVAEPDYMRSTAAAIHNSMRSVDPEAVWLLQGWMFVKNIFWTDAMMEAFLTAVPIGRLIVLDLQSEQFPQYQRTDSYYGQPFVWCMLHNFGGTLGMFGSADLVNNGIEAARRMPNSSIVGVGITPEGIGQNYVMYSLVLERGWSELPLDLDSWFKHFARTRYGVDDEGLQQAWQLLRRSVYSFRGLQKMRGGYTVTRRPALNLDPFTWYNASDVLEAWKLLLSSRAIIPLEDDKYAIYEHDLVDITRQYLQISADQLYVNLKSAYRKRQVARFEYLGSKLLQLFDDLEHILASGSNFLLGTWLADAQRAAPNAADKPNFEFNARNQITAWGPDGQILDYACKQWSGLVLDYYRPRWALFLDDVTLALHSNRTFNSTAFKLRVSQEVELPFSNKSDVYPVEPMGNTWFISQNIYERWKEYLRDTQFLHNNRISVNLKLGVQ
ncbi:alpha-N-acetylglucosaminidase [Drosophila pseudoobscura]|uniref:Alpha-N-acetylglucosaminidase n=1 Tax=Drosophila pseudoobscura pseudoobscura TaxID=46245 RepID=A0A6I8ULJ6_DROPS|nr:alpha-N-acetylglucosaminidase [Drosophila pseudoobscura]XP_033236940.1 alpha-N-acetylglucosaminidase [Drosophila pseudoobscura]